jgi:hypothetical protein
MKEAGRDRVAITGGGMSKDNHRPRRGSEGHGSRANESHNNSSPTHPTITNIYPDLLKFTGTPWRAA